MNTWLVMRGPESNMGISEVETSTASVLPKESCKHDGESTAHTMLKSLPKPKD